MVSNVATSSPSTSSVSLAHMKDLDAMRSSESEEYIAKHLDKDPWEATLIPPEPNPYFYASYEGGW